MSPTEIEKKLNKKRAEFFNAPYKGKLPENFMQNFKSAIFSVSPRSYNLGSSGLMGWVKMPLKDLNFGRVTKMAEIITMAPMKEIFSDFDSGIKQLEQIELILKDSTEKTNEFNNKIQREKIALENMTGKVKPQKSGLKNNEVLAIAK